MAVNEPIPQLSGGAMPNPDDLLVADAVLSSSVSRTLDPVPGRRVVLYLLAYLGSFLIFIMPLATALALKVDQLVPDARETALGIVMGVGALIAMIANPIFGSLSDRTTSRFGMRRPWILGGAIVALAFSAVMSFSADIFVAGAAWAGVQLALNAVLASLAAFIPDRVPEHQRGKVSAWTGIATQVAPLVGMVIGNVAFRVGGGIGWMILAPAAVGVLLLVLFVVTVKDRVLTKDDVVPFRFRDVFGAFAFHPRKNPDFAWAWAGRFLITLSFAALNTYMVYFMNARLGVALSEVAMVQLIVLVGTTTVTAATAAVAGSISDRIRRRKVFVWVASALIAVHHLVVAFTYDWALYVVSIAISAVAMGIYYAVDLALVTDVLPDKEGAAAKDMGVFNIASALPQSLAPALAPLALAIGGAGANYTALYLIAAAVAVLGALTVLPIKAVR